MSKEHMKRRQKEEDLSILNMYSKKSLTYYSVMKSSHIAHSIKFDWRNGFTNLEKPITL